MGNSKMCDCNQGRQPCTCRDVIGEVIAEDNARAVPPSVAQHALETVPELLARIEELEAHCVRLGQGGAERYWEGRWRDADAQIGDLVAHIERQDDAYALLSLDAGRKMEELERDAWISVEDRLPDECKAEYLCLFEGGQQQVTEWLLDETDGWIFWYGDPTHWMPLPAAPAMAAQAEK